MNLIWRKILMWALFSHLRGKFLQLFTRVCNRNRSSFLIFTLIMFLLHLHTSFNLTRNLMFYLFLQLQNLRLHLFHMFSLLKLRSFYLALKLRAYLLIHHLLYHFNLHSNRISLTWRTLDSSLHLMCLEIDIRTLAQN